jgi:hypothetical protein
VRTLVSLPPPKFKAPADAGRALQASIGDPRVPLTVADAATRSGLALRDAERGLAWLSQEYRGHLRVTESGELLHLFPHGFAKPWETRDAVADAARRVARGAVGLGRFVVRAWLLVVLLAYVAIFLAVLVGLMFVRQGDSDRRGGGLSSAIGYTLFRVLADALFWTFHPFSPLAVDVYEQPRRRRAQAEDKTPFYEKVNRFVFGPTPAKEEPRANERRILAEIRAQKGRIGLADVMRVTGLPRAEADPLMARLMLDYDGEVFVSEEGGIHYRFEELRKTADEAREARVAAAWERVQRPAPLSGNSVGTNVLIGALNVFNVIMSLVAFDTNLTLAKLPLLFSGVPLEAIPYAGTPIALGLVPLVFSLGLFLLPAARAIARPFQTKAAARENGRLGVLREILTQVERKAEVTEEGLTQAWTRAAGAPPEPKELTRQVVALGGDLEIKEESGQTRYRFVDLETEAAALEAERELASEEEKKPGRVVFGSDV